MNRVAIIAIASLAMVAIGADLVLRLQSPGHRVARVISAAYSAASPDIDTPDANEAGYRWAERRGIDQTDACPHYTAAFVAGCRAWVMDERPAELGLNPSN